MADLLTVESTTAASATVVHTCGGECAALAHWTSLTGPVTKSAVLARNQGGSIGIAAAGAAAYASHAMAAAHQVGRFGLYLTGAPSGDAALLECTSSLANNALLGYDSATGKLCTFGQNNWATRTLGPVISIRKWMVIDIHFDWSVGAPTIRWRVDGVVQTNHVDTGATGVGNNWGVGQQGNSAPNPPLATYTAYFDDVVVSNTAGNYPIADGFVVAGETYLDNVTSTDGYLLEDSSGYLEIESMYAQAVLDLAPFGYWRLGEAIGGVAANQVPGGSTLDYLNTPTLGVTGLLDDDPDTAVTFARASSEDAYRGVGTAAGGSTGQSVAAWIKLGSFAAAETHAFWSWALQSTTIGFHTLYFNATDATTGTLRWRYSDGTAVRTAISSSFTPGTDTHFITVRHDYAAETVIFGIDGVEETVDVSANGAPVAIISGKPIDIGGDVVNVNYYFNGTLDEVAVFTSVLTAQDVANLYVLGTARIPFRNRYPQLLAQ